MPEKKRKENREKGNEKRISITCKRKKSFQQHTNLPSFSFLFKNIIQTLSCVMPSTKSTNIEGDLISSLLTQLHTY